MRIAGLEEDIQGLNSETLSGSIDVTHLPAGAHQVELLLDLDEGKFTYPTIKINVYIVDPSAPEETPPSESESESESVSESEMEGN